jgi:single-stranded-DNA-specific exonuclease
MKTIKRRTPKGPIGQWSQETPEIIQRIFANRGVLNETDTILAAENLHPVSLLGGIEQAIERIVKAIREHQPITISGDYDCDGATATAVAVRGLKLLGARHVSFTIPDRFKHGYGLTPGLIDDLPQRPALLITVDSGVASHAGVKYAHDLGIDVIITDHHLPGETLPAEAVAIVNPNLDGDPFPSKALAGVGVMFYLLLALRKRLVALNMHAEPLASLLDIVALGTVADLVPLDRNNRILVAAGLYRIRKGRAHEGIKALMKLVGKDPEKVVAQDFGFAIAPRINAAGRLKDMRVGVELLLCDKPSQAEELAKKLDDINKERQAIQETMLAQAEALMEEAREDTTDRFGVTVFEPHWHAGVVGLVASRLKESFHRPVFAFAPGEGDETDLRGSGRSIEGFHLRDALARIDTRFPGLIPKFGGHAMAAGLSLGRTRLAEFSAAFNAVAKEALTDDQLQASVMSDGELHPGDISLDIADWIDRAGPWGQAFPQPCFDGVFRTMAWWRMSGDHVKLRLQDPRTGLEYDAVHFGGYQEDGYPPIVRVCYELNKNVFYQMTSLQLMVKALMPHEEPHSLS